MKNAAILSLYFASLAVAVSAVMSGDHEDPDFDEINASFDK